MQLKLLRLGLEIWGKVILQNVMSHELLKTVKRNTVQEIISQNKKALGRLQAVLQNPNHAVTYFCTC